MKSTAARLNTGSAHFLAAAMRPAESMEDEPKVPWKRTKPQLATGGVMFLAVGAYGLANLGPGTVDYPTGARGPPASPVASCRRRARPVG